MNSDRSCESRIGHRGTGSASGSIVLVIKICTLGAIMVMSCFVLSMKPAEALDFQIQPRLETGVTLYAIKIGAIHESIPTTSDVASGENRTQQKIEFKDTMRFLGGGVTWFANRLFVDLGLQYSLDGKDDTQASYSIYDEDGGDGSSTFISTAPEYKGEFHRHDLAVSFGYAVTEQFSIFLGYKWAQLELETDSEGPYRELSIDNYIASGTRTAAEHLQFKYEGPFIGLAHGWQVEWSSEYRGLFSISLGLARLNCRLDQDQDGNIRIDWVSGEGEIAPYDNPYTFKNEVSGDTLGLVLALGWQGVTPIKHLAYSIVISGYRYQFDLDDPTYSNVTESSVVCKVGLSYYF